MSPIFGESSDDKHPGTEHAGATRPTTPEPPNPGVPHNADGALGGTQPPPSWSGQRPHEAPYEPPIPNPGPAQGYPPHAYPLYPVQPGWPGMGVTPQAPYPRYAELSSRLLGYFLDGLFAALVYVPFYVLMFVATAASWLSCAYDIADISESGTISSDACSVGNPAVFVVIILLAIGAQIGWLIYCCKQLGATGQTPGKRIAGVRVVDADTGAPIGTRRAFGRYLALAVSNLFCGLGLLSATWDARSQGWHDKMARTVVIDAKTPPPTYAPPLFTAHNPTQQPPSTDSPTRF